MKLTIIDKFKSFDGTKTAIRIETIEIDEDIFLKKLKKLKENLEKLK